MPRAALLSIHARVEGVTPSTWEDSSLVHVWGPRYHVYLVAARDLPVFTLARLPDGGKTRRRAEDLADRLHALLGGARMRYDDAGEALGVHGNALRYAALTGTLAIRWEGARRPVVWTVPPPEIDPGQATLELARRFVHIFGPATPHGLAEWAGIAVRTAASAFDDLAAELMPVRTPSGDPGSSVGTKPPSASLQRPRRPPDSCPAATLTPWASRKRIARSWCRTPAGGASCGHRACGRAPSSSRERSSAHGVAPTRG